MFFTTLAYAQEVSAESAQGAGPMPIQFAVFMYLIIFFIFYVLLIRPQQKQQKQKLDMIGALKKNDQVITAGGIHGTVVNVKDQTIVLKIDDNVKVEFEKNSISTVTKSRTS